MEWVACVGIDWADQKHDYALLGRKGEQEGGTFGSRPEQVHDWVKRLRERYPVGTIVVAMEQSRGALRYALSTYDFFALVPINPRAVSAYRQSLHLSGAKDDPVDASLIRDFAAAHLDQLPVWRADSAVTRKLQLLVEYRRQLVDQRTAWTQELIATVKQYFPQVLTWFGSHVALLGAFLTEWPTLEQARRARAERLGKVLRRGGRLSDERLTEIVASIQSALPLTSDEAIIDALALRTSSIIAVLQQLGEQVRRHDQLIAQIWAEHEDHDLFASFPGAGPILAPRLAVAFGSDRSRFADAAEMENYSGTSPVTRRSGKHHAVHARWQRPKFLHQTFHEFAEASIPHCAWARAYYHQQRERGAGHRSAIRALAFRWIRILYVCWKTRTTYDDTIHMADLKRRGSGLCHRLVA
jgi:transposase